METRLKAALFMLAVIGVNAIAYGLLRADGEMRGVLVVIGLVALAAAGGRLLVERQAKKTEEQG